MRITIETDDRNVATPDIKPVVAPAQSTDTNGGMPAETNNQPDSRTSPDSSGQAGISAGPPPDWLIEAIQNTDSSSGTATSGTSTDLDAGAATNNGY